MNIYFEKPAKKRKNSPFVAETFTLALWVVLFGWIVLRSFPEVF